MANAKNFSQFKQKYASLYKELDQESVKKFLRWDQSIKTNNMRRMLKQSALVRDNSFKGGIKEYAKQMGKIGKFASQLKIAGYVSIAADVVSSSVTVYEAAPEALQPLPPLSALWSFLRFLLIYSSCYLKLSAMNSSSFFAAAPLSISFSAMRTPASIVSVLPVI